MNKFVYVFSADDRDMLLSRGYHLMKSDEKNGVYIFQNVDTIPQELYSSANDVKTAFFTDTLTF